MKIIFFGTPDYVIPILDKLHKYHEIVAVVTQSPKPVGRDKIVTYSAVDAWAFKKHIIRNFDYVDLPKADMGVCASFGMIIPKIIIDKFPLGILNIHPSLLPMFRGSSPIQATLISGVNPTGVSIIKMNEKVDEGAILTQFKEEVLEEDDNISLRNRLFEKSAEVLINMIPAYIDGKIKLKLQDSANATYTTRINKNDAFIEFEIIKNAIELNSNTDFDAVKLNRFIKAMKPWPIAWTKIMVRGEEKRIKLLNAHIDSKSGYLVLDEVQLEGKKPTTWEQFKSSYSLVF